MHSNDPRYDNNNPFYDGRDVHQEMYQQQQPYYDYHQEGEGGIVDGPFSYVGGIHNEYGQHHTGPPIPFMQQQQQQQQIRHPQQHPRPDFLPMQQHLHYDYDTNENVGFVANLMIEGDTLPIRGGRQFYNNFNAPNPGITRRSNNIHDEYETYNNRPLTSNNYGADSRIGISQQQQHNVIFPDQIRNQHHPFEHHHDVEEVYGISPISDPVLAFPNNVHSRVDVEPGSYYPIPSIEPETIFGSPITAIAYDDCYSAMYVATATKALISTNNTSFDNIQHRSRGRGPKALLQYRGGRAAMMTVHDLNNGGMLYSSIQSHPEAESNTLKAIYESIYGVITNNNTGSPVVHAGSAPKSRVPNHAYKPPYGDTVTAATNGVAVSDTFGLPNTYQMGVTAILPVTGHGNVISVSPAAVRIHTHGGLQIADNATEGLISGTFHPVGSTRNSDVQYMMHVSVGGIASSSSPFNSKQKYHVQCMDIWQGLRPVASCLFKDTTAVSNESATRAVAVTALGRSNGRKYVIAGCSDGTLRLLDGHGLLEVGKMKSHSGGVVDLAVSDDGILIATTGYGSLASTRRSESSGGDRSMYAFPDTSILIYDIRYMGRGPIPHPFAGLRGGPRFVSFIPNTDENQSTSRLLAGSGQTGGGMQIIVPFLEENIVSKSGFIIPQLGRGEEMSCMCVSEDNLAIGTTQGKVLQYKLAGYDPNLSSTLPGTLSTNQSGAFIPSTNRRAQSGGSSVSTLSRGASSSRSPLIEKQPLKMPPFQPSLAPLSLEPSLLLNEDANNRMGTNEKMKSIFGSYILTSYPTVSCLLGDHRDKSSASFGLLASDPMVSQISLRVSPDLVKKATQAADFLQTVPTSSLNVDLFEDHRAQGNNRDRKKADVLLNPNKMVYNNKLFHICYSESLNRDKRYGKSNRRLQRGQLSTDSTEDEVNLIDLPVRYKIKLRPGHMSASSFTHGDYNESGLLPGWDYSVTMPNAFVSPIVMLLFSISEIRLAVLKAQLGRSPGRELSLMSELGFLFHRIESISKLAMVFPTDGGGSNGIMTRLDAWAPTSFVSILSTMPEAEQLQILDSSPAAVASPRRPEAFYRFLLYNLNKEMGNGSNKLVELLAGVDFVSVNQFVSGTGKESKAITKQLTVELAYENFLMDEVGPDAKPCFGEILQSSLCRATELGAWNQSSKSYDTIVQRKILTSLPTILSLSAQCAGGKPNEGVSLWQNPGNENGSWLPEYIEIEIDGSGSVIVREIAADEKTGSETLRECRGKDLMPESISRVVKEMSNGQGPEKRRYRLEAVVSFVRDDMDKNCPEEIRWGNRDEVPYGHHVLHMRVTKDEQKDIIKKQRDELNKLLASEINPEVLSMTILGRNVDRETLRKRLDYADERLAILNQENDDKSRWLLFNQFVVSDTVSEDARSFHFKFKEPALIVFRATDGLPGGIQLADFKSSNTKIPAEVIRTSSITNGARSPHVANQKPSNLPGAGELVAFDAEFVSLQEEESILTLSGSKVTIRETRHALARVSVLDGRNRRVIFDDHVQPNEPVSDYLTRFSGILPEDLNPKQSRHHLISSRAAYLKLRCLAERGCIFVGHGLMQDFWTANLTIPAYQVIDTVDIYHKPAQRFISLRFLANYVLDRDMQQDVHDSIEDATGALDLYARAVELKREGKFESILDRLYEFGQKADWKLGVA